ncbi:hypothetical protein [Hydrogenimonas sp.]|uniref:hypothetical protein n=1 Tax=Hydrogenimonas sp. TaxID=2231112 RepID=UPI0026324F64|nr:hypothetical protein [Hydrogenimonas sp.]
MREENYIAFCVVFGFFSGLMVGFLTQNDPFDMLSIIMLTTLFFYMLAHVSVALFIRFMEFGRVHFEKEAYDRKLDYFYNQLLQREAGFETNHAYFSNGDNHMKNMKKGKTR